MVNDFLGHCTLYSIVNRRFVLMGFPFMLFSGALWDEYRFANVTEIKIKLWKQSTKKSNYENTKRKRRHAPILYTTNGVYMSHEQEN